MTAARETGHPGHAGLDEAGDPRFGLRTASIASALRNAGVDVRIVADAVNRPGFHAEAFAEFEDAAFGDGSPAQASRQVPSRSCLMSGPGLPGRAFTVP